jgi:5-(carboxyamino)imidazole ribonucleotide synthase
VTVPGHMERRRTVTSRILPGSTIGFLGGGQLGRMTAMAARSLGYSVHAMDPDPECSAAGVVDRVVRGKFDDADAADDLARYCDVVTMEIEQIGGAALDAAERHAPVRPSPSVLEVVRDRSRQKRWLVVNGFPLGPYEEVASLDELLTASAALGSPLFIKANHGGYDGRGQYLLSRADEAEDAWTALGARPSVAEKGLDLGLELSMMVARTPDGQTAVYPPAVNHHERQVLAWSMIPGPLDPEVVLRATDLAHSIASALRLEGILAVEMFLTRGGELLVNELAPRPHNSFHATEAACVTSQFEQLVRAICNLPLGDTTALRPAAIVNLFGELWDDGAPRFDLALEVPRARLHLYGKKGARAGRKMGHIAATGETAEAALRTAQESYRRLVEG